MSWQIRPAVEADVPRLVQLWEDSVRATHDFLTDAHREALRGMLASDFFPMVSLWLACDADGAFVGFLGLDGGKVEMLFVDPQRRGGGVGRALMQFATRQHQASEVDVNEQNVQALGFYAKLGFEVHAGSPQDGMGWPYPLLHLRRTAPTMEA